MTVFWVHPSQAQNFPRSNPIPENSSPPPTEVLPEPELNFSVNEQLIAPDEGSDTSELIDPGERLCVTLTFESKNELTFKSDELFDAIAKALPTSQTIECNRKNQPENRFYLTFGELLQARAAVVQHYLNKGYVGTIAYIPQDREINIDNEAIPIQIREGEIEEIRIAGTERLTEGYIRDRITHFTHGALNRNSVLEALRLLQFNPLIKRVEAELFEGSAPNKAILEVAIEERKTLVSLHPRIDNDRSPSVGSDRQSLRATLWNVSGVGDRLDGAIRHTLGSTDGEIGYQIPVNAQEGTIGAIYRFGDGLVTESPFDKIDLESEYRSYELQVRQPLVRRATSEVFEEFALGLRFSRQESQTSILGTDFPLAEGADDQGRSSVSALRFSQEWQRLTASSGLFFVSEFSLGLDWFNATVNGESRSGDRIPDSNFFLWRGQAQWLQVLAEDTTLLLRASGQWADRSLLGFEQFSLGGRQTVRGYRQDVRLSDMGILGSAELLLPIQRFTLNRNSALQNDNGLISIVPFFDAGVGWNSSGNESINPNALIGTGLGLQVTYNDVFRMRLDWGFPLIEIDSTNKTWQENGIYFYVEYDLY